MIVIYILIFILLFNIIIYTLPTLLSIYKMGYVNYITKYRSIRSILSNIKKSKVYFTKDTYYIPIFFNTKHICFIYFKCDISDINWGNIRIIESLNRNYSWSSEYIEDITNCAFMRILSSRIVNNIKDISYTAIGIKHIDELGSIINSEVQSMNRDDTLNKILNDE